MVGLILEIKLYVVNVDISVNTNSICMSAQFAIKLKTQIKYLTSHPNNTEGGSIRLKTQLNILKEYLITHPNNLYKDNVGNY